MARPSRPSRTLPNVIQAGAIEVYNEAYQRAGRGARGRRAAEEAVSRTFPGVGRDTIEGVANRADQSRGGAGRINKGGPGYRLDPKDHADTTSGAPSQGRRRRAQYSYHVVVSYTVYKGGAVLLTGTHEHTVIASEPPTKGEIEQEANDAARGLIAAYLTLYWDVRGTTTYTIDSIRITTAERELV